MRLTQRQKEILVGLILGDGCLEKNGNNVRLRVEHGLKQGEYLSWLYYEFQNFTAQKPRIVSSKHSKRNKVYERLHFSTLSLNCFNEYYSKFYEQKIKIVPGDIKEILKSPLSLAVWYMDDGYKRNDCDALRLSTDSFTKKEQKQLLYCLKSNFSIEVKLHKKGKAWNIYIPNREAVKFCDLVSPYLVPTMKYKLI